MLHRRALLTQAAGLAMAAAIPAAAHAEGDFPARPVKLYVTFGPGSGPDTLARTIGPEITKHLGQPIVIENRPAAGGNVAAQQLLQERHDGYTMLLATDSLMTMNPFLLPKSNFDVLKDFQLVAPIAEASVLLVVHPSLKVDSPKELAALVKAHPHKYTYFAPTGTPHHLLAERFTDMNDLDWVRVSYREPQLALNEMLSGMVPIGFASYPHVAGAIKAGKLKALAVSTGKRLDSLPQVPTLSESYPGLAESGWFAVYVPQGTPAPVVAKLAQAVEKARDSAKVQERLKQFGMRAIDDDAAAFKERVQQDYLRREDLIRRRGIRID